MLERFTADAGVEAVASAWRAPLYGSPRRLGVVRSGRKEWASYNLVSPGYFAVFRIPLLRGRLFTQAEAESESPVVIVGEGVARVKGRIGRSLGCPAVRSEISRELIETLRGGALVLAYYPDPVWLRTSQLAGS